MSDEEIENEEKRVSSKSMKNRSDIYGRINYENYFNQW